MVICIAGASGFVGKALIERLISTTDHRIVALSRSPRKSQYPDRLEWRQCDLFSQLDIEAALEGCDLAIYLVHSMLPSAHLVQGSFEDFDAVLADNFAHGMQKKGIKRCLYLGGIIPEAEHLSAHLRSRLEVEDILESTGVSLVSLRAGLIIGAEGSSFQIMYNLIKRLWLIPCLPWTTQPTCPTALSNVLDSLVLFLKATIKAPSKKLVYDLGPPESTSYRNLMQLLAKKLKLKRIFFSFPNFSLRLSRWSVSFIAGAPKALVYPLIASLKHSMIPHADLRVPGDEIKWKNSSEALDEALTQKAKQTRASAFHYTSSDKDKEVRSLQRFVLENPQTAKSVADRYFQWLPRFYWPIIRVGVDKGRIDFKVPFLKKPLLILHHSPARSSMNRQLYYIRGGLLALGTGRGRLEFRSILGGKAVIAAIHEFKPRLPWYIYKFTQALAHLFTMNAFRRHLTKDV